MLSNVAIIPAEALAQAARALADPARVRLLRLCADRPTSVSELAAAVAESEPNVSRQLKQLALAGLLRRVRRGQRVEYLPATESGFATVLVGWVLEHLDPDEPTLREARARLRARELDARGATVRGAAQEWLTAGRLGRTLRGTLELELARDVTARRVLVRSRYREVLDALLASRAQLTLRSASRHEHQALRAWADSEEGQIEVLSTREALAQPRFETCIELPPPEECLDEGSVRALLERSRGRLVPEGVLWCALPYEALEASGAPPVRLRSLLHEQGFDCLALMPIEAEGRHLLIARARLRLSRGAVSTTAALSA